MTAIHTRLLFVDGTGCELLQEESMEEGWCPQSPDWWYISVNFGSKVYVIQDISIEVLSLIFSSF